MALTSLDILVQCLMKQYGKIYSENVSCRKKNNRFPVYNIKNFYYYTSTH